MAFLAALLFPPSKPAAPKTAVAAPAPPPPPPAPPPDPAVAVDQAADAGSAAARQRILRRRGQSATVVTSPLGVTTSAPAPATLGGR